MLGNTVFWPIEPLANRAFSAIMSSGPMQRRILGKNLLVERFLLGELGGTLTEAEADHYRQVQPTERSRRGLAVMPREIRAARPLLDRLARDVPALLGHKPALAVWGDAGHRFSSGNVYPADTCGICRSRRRRTAPPCRALRPGVRAGRDHLGHHPSVSMRGRTERSRMVEGWSPVPYRAG